MEDERWSNLFDGVAHLQEREREREGGGGRERERGRKREREVEEDLRDSTRGESCQDLVHLSAHLPSALKEPGGGVCVRTRLRRTRRHTMD